MNNKTKQIPEALPQFIDSAALIVVAGSHSAHLYYVQDGYMREIDKTESDFVFDEREGFFLSSHPTVDTMGAGAPDMIDKGYERDRFQKQLANEIIAVMRSQKIPHLYIFSSKESASILVDNLENDVKDRVRHVERRNLQSAHPIELLEYIKEA